MFPGGSLTDPISMARQPWQLKPIMLSHHWKVILKSITHILF